MGINFQKSVQVAEFVDGNKQVFGLVFVWKSKVFVAVALNHCPCAGNHEFVTAKESTLKSIKTLSENLPEVDDFMKEFVPPYGKTLDDLINNN